MGDLLAQVKGFKGLLILLEKRFHVLEDVKEILGLDLAFLVKPIVYVRSAELCPSDKFEFCEMFQVCRKSGSG